MCVWQSIRPGSSSAREINDLRASGKLFLAGWCNAIDSFATNDDDLILQDFARTYVEQFAGSNIDWSRGSRLLCDGHGTRKRSGLRHSR